MFDLDRLRMTEIDCDLRAEVDGSEERWSNISVYANESKLKLDFIEVYFVAI